MAENKTDVKSEVPGEQELRGDGEIDITHNPKTSSLTEGQTESPDDEKVLRHELLGNGETVKDTPLDKQTRIPISRLRRTVEQVKTKNQFSKSKSKPPSQIPRRTSLPKTAEPKTPDPSPLDDEFDKLFQEVVTNTDETIVANLETKFEEIIHDYEENKIQPIDVEKIKKTRIPFLKRRSLQDGDGVHLRTDKIIAARDKIRLRKSISVNDEKYEKVSKDIVDIINAERESKKDDSESTNTKNETDKPKIIKLENRTENNYISETESSTKTINYNTNEALKESLISEGNDSKNIETKLMQTNSVSNNQESKITQTSNESESNTIQEGMITQISVENENKSIQEGNITQVSVENESKIIQEGIIIQTIFANESNTIEEVKITQTNIENESNVIQEGIVTQTIVANESSKNQKGNITQISLENESNTIQEGKVTQITVKNESTVIQKTELTQSAAVNEKTSIQETKITNHSLVNDNTVIQESKTSTDYQSDSYFNQETKTTKSLTNDNEVKVTETNINQPMSIENASEETKTEINRENTFETTKSNEMDKGEDNITTKKQEKTETEPNIVEKNKNYTTEILLEENVVKYTIKIGIPLEKSEVHESVTKVQENNDSYNKENEMKVNQNMLEIYKNMKPELRTPNYESKETLRGKETGYISNKNERDEYTTNFKGKVGRIISRIDSRENECERRELIDEVPKKKTILSKIALFERHEPETNKTKKAKPKLTNLITKDFHPEVRQHVDTPLIVSEVFKPFRESIKVENPIKESEEDLGSTKDSVDLPQEKYPNDDKPSTPISDAPVIIPKLTPVREILSKFEPKTKENFTAKKSIQNTSKYELKNELLKSNYEAKHIEKPLKINVDIEKETILENKSKSTSENELKNNINRVLYRLKSFEKIESNKKEVLINRNELPRRKSVSEKIALFEGKLTPIKGQNVKTTTPTPNTTVQSPTPIVEDLEEKINELKTQYGTVNVPGKQLRNGVTMPVIAVGTANLNPKLIKHIIGAAIDMGYRAIDTAYIYGNEKEVGEAIQAKIDDGTVKREDLFIINKLWSTFHQEDLVKGACEASLKAMGLEYFDLYLVHNPMSFKEGPSPLPKIATVLQYSENTFLNAWHGMESLITAKLVRAIGVSNFNSAQVQRVMDKGKVKPVVNQVECHPYLSQQRLSKYCTDRNITLSCFGVLGSKGTPAEYRGLTPAVIDDPLVKVLASGLGITPAQLLISYQLKNNHTVVVKSSTAAHLWDNLQAVNVKLSSAEVEGLHMLNRNKRIFTFVGMGDTHKNYPFNIPF